MIIDTLGTTDALRVTQRGTGNAILVEDDTNPDSSAFVVNSAGDVGIGTITPRSKLDLGANVIAGVSNIRGHSNSGAYSIWGGLGSDSSINGGYIQLYGSTHSINPHLVTLGNSNAGTRLLIASGGNVGIGTANPSGTLDVTANTTGAALFISQQNIDGYAILIQDNGGPDKPFVVKNRGFVGVGTISPNKELTVVGDISAAYNIYSKDIYLNRGDTQREGGQINFNRSYDNTNAFAIDTYTDNIGSLSSRLRFIYIPSNAERMTMLSSGDFGIGTANPISKLHVEGDITVSNGRYLNLATNGQGHTAIRRNTGQNGMEFFTSSASRMFIADAGNVGIGTLYPTSKLHLSGSINDAVTLLLETDSSSQETSVDFICNSTGGRRWRLGTGGTAGGYANGSIGFYDVTSGSMKMMIASSGNVAIGTNYPTEELHVSKINAGSETVIKVENPSTTNGTQARFDMATGTPNAYAVLYVEEDSTINPHTRWGAGEGLIGGTLIGIASAAPFIIQDANKERMRILSSGNVGIGTDSPTDRLYVTDSGGTMTNITRPGGWGGGITTFDVYAGGTIGVGSMTGDLSASIGNNGVIMGKSLAGIGNRAVYSDANGVLTNTASDGTLKENVSAVSQGLNEVLQLNPVSFTWKDTEKHGSQKEIGFIAQEVQPLIPEVIGENFDGTLSLDYAKMISVLTKAIQELNDKVEAQAAEITSLNAKIK
jgi:hypothetical protein